MSEIQGLAKTEDKKGFLVSRGRCGCETVRLRQPCCGRCELPAIVMTPKKSLALAFLRPAKRKTLRFLQRTDCEPACGHRRGHCDL